LIQIIHVIKICYYNYVVSVCQCLVINWFGSVAHNAALASRTRAGSA